MEFWLLLEEDIVAERKCGMVIAERDIYILFALKLIVELLLELS